MKAFISKLINEIKLIPKPVKVFGIKALSMFIVWQLVYLFFLMPNRTLDAPLSLFTGKSTVLVLEAVQFSDSLEAKEVTFTQNTDNQKSTYNKTTIFLNGRRLLGISDSCNGLSLFILYFGFLICYPSKIIHKLKFTLIGLIAIFVANVLRCCALCMIHYKYPQLLDFAHHYLFNILIYSLIFFLWIVFSKKHTILTKEYE